MQILFKLMEIDKKAVEFQAEQKHERSSKDVDEKLILKS